MVEFIAVFFSLLSVWLTTKKNIACWAVGSIGILFYAILFYQKSDIANFGLQFIFLAQSIIGWKNWSEKSNDINISKFNTFGRVKLFILIFFTYYLVYFIADVLNGNLTALDSFTATISFFGMYLLGRGKLESWTLWIIADVFYVYFFILNKLYLSSGLYLIFLVLAFYGFYNWKKSLTYQQQKN